MRAMASTFRLDITDGVGWLTLTQPRHLNPLNLAGARDLRQAVADIRRDPAIRALVLTGEGRSFSAGGDVGEFHANLHRTSDFFDELIGHLHATITDLLAMPKPVVAGVNGVVAGGAMGLFMAADLAIAAERASFVMAYTGIGVSPDGGSTFFLPRMLGSRRALELLLTNRKLSAREALDWGLVNQVVADDQLDATMRALAARLASGPTRAFAQARALVLGSHARSAADQLEAEKRALLAMAATADFREGVTAFVEKRTPTFTGR